MALVGNGARLAHGPLRVRGAGLYSAERGTWGRAGELRNIGASEARIADVTDRGGYPAGNRHPNSWSMSTKAGGLATFRQAVGVGTLVAAGAMGVNLSGTAAGTSTAAATGQLVVSGSGSAAGTSSATANVVAALAASGTAAGTGTATGTVTALGWASGSSVGVGTATATRYAVGHLSGAISPFTELSPESLAAAVLDTEDAIEAGLTLRQAMRLATAVLAGNMTKSGGTVTYRNAVADDTDRLVADVDADSRDVTSTDLD